MSVALLEKVKSYLTADAVRLASTALGEDEASVAKAFNKAIPLVMKAFQDLSNRPGGTDILWNMTRDAHAAGLVNNVEQIIDPTGVWHERGKELMRSMLDEEYTGQVEAIAQGCALPASAVENLLSIAAPITLGAMGQQAAEQRLDAIGLGKLLRSQRLTDAATPVSMSSGAPWTIISASGDLGADNRHGKSNPLAGFDPQKFLLRGRNTRSVWLALVAIAVAIGGYLLGHNSSSAVPDSSLSATPTTSVSDAQMPPSVAAQNRYDKLASDYVYKELPAEEAAGSDPALSASSTNSPSTTAPNPERAAIPKLSSETNANTAVSSSAKRRTTRTPARRTKKAAGFLRSVGSRINRLFRGSKTQRKQRYKTKRSNAAVCPCTHPVK
ncbi:DUF937 domain-containing protein [Hymenobacter sp. BT491]|uniref:DUF937 domain-containing protein n=1 Tax=Hymenobacter sp. BT491 TaxID=2766779 RepID=UPI001653D224|nr:DUF937 domain-containing protein [Hymenobacter sp. BT491]MBC6988043.1 DUF937 domain-containing protein [Hymenobacter sp. BT491]